MAPTSGVSVGGELEARVASLRGTGAPGRTPDWVRGAGRCAVERALGDGPAVRLPPLATRRDLPADAGPAHAACGLTPTAASTR